VKQDLHLLHAGFLLGLFFYPQVGATFSSETSVDFHRATLRVFQNIEPFETSSVISGNNVGAKRPCTEIKQLKTKFK
jgi:hypothetical protein